MYKTLLAIEDSKLLLEIQKLDIWNGRSGFEIAAVVKDEADAQRIASGGGFDLVISQIRSSERDEPIKAKSRSYHQSTVMISEKLTLHNARYSIINGASDYFVPPFEERKFLDALERIKQSKLSYRSKVDIYADELTDIFVSRDDLFKSIIAEVTEKIYSLSSDSDMADTAIADLLRIIAENVFDKNEWLDLYINKEDVLKNKDMMNNKQFAITALSDLFDDFSELYPLVHSNKINQVLLYILNNPESDLKQKNIASSLYMNSSYLSTVFTAHTEQRFIDYLTNVKLRRAAWLLRNTTLKITDIAEKLDYKDMGYFSRLFKKKYGVTPSDYRVPDNYVYCI